VSLSVVPSGSHYAAIDEASLDTGDYVYVYNSGLSGISGTDRFNFPDQSLAGAISQVAIKAVAKFTYDYSGAGYNKVFNGGGTMTLYQKVRANEVSQGFTLTTSNATYTFSRTLNPAGSAWTWADINDLIGGIYLYCNATCSIPPKQTAGGGSMAYQMWVEITYTEGWANIAKVNGVSQADIDKLFGINKLSIAKINGVAV